MRFIELERFYELAFLEKNISTPADFLIFVLHYSLQMTVALMFDMKHDFSKNCFVTSPGD